MLGYLTYNYNGIDVSNQIADIENYSETLGDVQLVSTQNVYSENNVVSEVNDANSNTIINNNTNDNNSNSNSSSTTPEDLDDNENNESSQNSYFEESRFERDKMYSEMLEVYENILANDSITNEQKAIAENEITAITNIKSGILISENLIKVKGFEDVVIFVNDAKATVVVKAESLKEEHIAQIQNIIVKQLNIDISDISITSREE